jgi:SAM-dependent methyltransferase
MSDAWYNAIAVRNNGYRTTAKYVQVGVSGETEFEKRLRCLIQPDYAVVDAGCGHGQFTNQLANIAKEITGFDSAIEMIKIANSTSHNENVRFLYGSTKNDLPFVPGSIDLVFSRRGPTSIINHKHILKNGGIITGIHSDEKETVIQRLSDNGYKQIEIDDFNESYILFDSISEYAKFLSDFPGNPDYESRANAKELEKNVKEHIENGIIKIKEYRFIWKAYS